MKKAFTLIELIFVIVIIGILAAVAVPKFMTVEQNAKIKPMQEIGDQVVNKVNERYENIQDANITRAIHADSHILQYLNELTTNIDKHFLWDANASDFYIYYDPTKTQTGNKDTDGNLITTTDSTITKNGALCLHVERWSVQVPVTIDANTTRYDYNISEFNASCITAAE